MSKPINIFYNVLDTLKNLNVAVKIGNARATLNGVVLAQLNAYTFKVLDEKGNEGVCSLVNKEVSKLNDNEMSIIGYVLKNSLFVYISKVINEKMIDFNNTHYTYEIDHDSTTSILALTPLGVSNVS
jgi:hypothetical protein